MSVIELMISEDNNTTPEQIAEGKPHGKFFAWDDYKSVAGIRRSLKTHEPDGSWYDGNDYYAVAIPNWNGYTLYLAKVQEVLNDAITGNGTPTSLEG